MNLGRAPWLHGVRPQRAVRLHPRRARQPLEPASSKMGWPFLWPADEPWPSCRQRNPEMVPIFEAAIERSKGLPTPRGIDTVLLERYRSGHNAAYLPILQLSRPEFHELPFPGDSDLFQLLWCPMVHFEGGGGYLIFWRRAEAIMSLRVEPPPPAVDGYWIAPSAFDPERINDYPTRFEVTPPPIASLDSETDWWRTMEDSDTIFPFPTGRIPSS